jgi:5'-3' exonuclease
MGVSGLWVFLNDIIKNIDINKIASQPIIIDINLYIYKYVIGFRNKQHLKYTTTPHIYALYRILKLLLTYNIMPICIFDGKSPRIKEKLINKRKKNSQNALDALDAISDTNIDSDAYIKKYKKSFILTHEMIEDCKIFLNYTGIPYVESIGESDPQCAALCHYYNNIISGVLSDDSDILAYGSKKIFKEINIHTNEIMYISQNELIEYLQTKTNIICKENNINSLTFTFNSFIDFTIILGNDFTYGIRTSHKINREEIFKLFVLNEFNIEKMIEYIYIVNEQYNKIVYYIPENFLDKYKEIKNNYTKVKIINPADININMTKPNLSKLKEYLIFNNMHSDDILIISNMLIKSYESYNKN